MDLAGDTQVHVEAGISSCRKRNGDVSSHRDTPHIVNNESALEQELQVIGGLEDNTQASRRAKTATMSTEMETLTLRGRVSRLRVLFYRKARTIVYFVRHLTRVTMHLQYEPYPTHLGRI